MNRKKLISVVGILLALVMLAGLVPVISLAEYKEYQFLNPLGTIEPRQETRITDRQGIVDILEAEGERTLRLGTTWYYKPLDADPAVALGQMLKEKWEAEYPPGLTVQIVTPDPSSAAGANMSTLPAADGPYIPYIGHAWNIRAEQVYDMIADKVDAVIMGTGD